MGLEVGSSWSGREIIETCRGYIGKQSGRSWISARTALCPTFTPHGSLFQHPTSLPLFHIPRNVSETRHIYMPNIFSFISIQHSAFGNRQSAIGNRQSAISISLTFFQPLAVIATTCYLTFQNADEEIRLHPTAMEPPAYSFVMGKKRRSLQKKARDGSSQIPEKPSSDRSGKFYSLLRTSAFVR